MGLSSVVSTSLLAAIISVTLLSPIKSETQVEIKVPEDLQDDYTLNWKIAKHLSEFKELIQKEKDDNIKKQMNTIYKMTLQAWIHTFNPESLVKAGDGKNLDQVEGELKGEIVKVGKEVAKKTIESEFIKLSEELDSITDTYNGLIDFIDQLKATYAFKHAIKNLYLQSYAVDFEPEVVKGAHSVKVDFFDGDNKEEFNIPLNKGALRQMIKENIDYFESSDDDNGDNSKAQKSSR